MTVEGMIRKAVGVKGDVKRVVFRDDNRIIDCLVPDDSLWVAVKDNFLLSEYERCGLYITNFTGTVIDAGAHAGLFSLKVASHASNVIALEPHPINSLLLRINLLRNRTENVVVVEKALWKSRGPVAMAEGNHSAAHMVVDSDSDPGSIGTITLDDLVESTGPVDLLKLDIEGAEFDVIATARSDTLGKIGAIVAELHLHGQEGRATEMVEKLRSNGFIAAVRAPPIEFWGDSTARLLASWGRLRGHTRLKTVLVAAYAAAACERWLGKRRARTRSELAFLYAKRIALPDDRPGADASDS